MRYPRLILPLLLLSTSAPAQTAPTPPGAAPAAASTAAIAPSTSPTPFALTTVTLAQINASTPYFTVDGYTPEVLATPPAKLADLQVLRLWPGQAPLQQGDVAATDFPTLTVYLPPDGKASGAAMIIFPGGAYSHVSPREGIPAGQWLASNGITAFILHYRVGQKYHYPAETDDGQRAIRYVRANAAAWGLDPARIGIIGFSAGGHLGSYVATHFDAGNPNSDDPVERVSDRPDLHILLYPVITLSEEPLVEKGSRNYLLGSNPDPELLKLLSNDLQVTKDTPPAFIVASTQDNTVPVANSDHYTNALQKNNVPYVFLREPLGGHGFGVTPAWSPQAMAWLHSRKF
jgi:acetyl esterase/lipase